MYAMIYQIIFNSSKKLNKKIRHFLNTSLYRLLIVMTKSHSTIEQLVNIDFKKISSMSDDYTNCMIKDISKILKIKKDKHSDPLDKRRSRLKTDFLKKYEIIKTINVPSSEYDWITIQDIFIKYVCVTSLLESYKVRLFNKNIISSKIVNITFIDLTSLDVELVQLAISSSQSNYEQPYVTCDGVEHSHEDFGNLHMYMFTVVEFLSNYINGRREYIIDLITEMDIEKIEQEKPLDDSHKVVSETDI